MDEIRDIIGEVFELGKKYGMIVAERDKLANELFEARNQIKELEREKEEETNDD